jgi:hypothetical protein
MLGGTSERAAEKLQHRVVSPTEVGSAEMK